MKFSTWLRTNKWRFAYSLFGRLHSKQKWEFQCHTLKHRTEVYFKRQDNFDVAVNIALCVFNNDLCIWMSSLEQTATIVVQTLMRHTTSRPNARLRARKTGLLVFQIISQRSRGGACCRRTTIRSWHHGSKGKNLNPTIFI